MSQDLTQIDNVVRESSAFVKPDNVVSSDVVMAEPSDVSDPMHICANRTKPVQNNNDQKRVGAKKAKKLELSADS